MVAEASKKELSRREFFYAVGTAAPALSLLPAMATGTPRTPPEAEEVDSSAKFSPIDLSTYFNSSSRDFGARQISAYLRVMVVDQHSEKDALIRVPGGRRNLQGIPFLLGPEEIDSKSWIVLSTTGRSGATPRVEIPVQQKACFLCLASFTDFDENESPRHGEILVPKTGQHLADVVLVYEDGKTLALPIRRGFESSAPFQPGWANNPNFAARLPGKTRARKLGEPLPSATGWGPLQTVVTSDDPRSSGNGTLWISALENPEPDKLLRAVRLEAVAEDRLAVCGLTLYHHSAYPLRFEPRALYRISLPEAPPVELDRWQVDVDLGEVGRTFALPDFHPDAWVNSPAAGLGEWEGTSTSAPHLYVEVAANVNATLSLRDSKTGDRWSFDLSKVVPGKELASERGGGRIEIVEQGRRWIHIRVIDPDTRKPTPVRVAIRSKEGRYIPPYGHRSEINTGWFQDYGADVKLMDTSFAYVDGTFQVELPPGEFYLELTKGFEHRAVRQKVEIQPGQRELTVEFPRFCNLRSQGWVTADTHVHFLSPTTCLLEAQAEGLNLVNLLAAQLGGLFTSIGDLSYGPLTTPDQECMVWMGTENRQHFLGHISLEGMRGQPVFPLSADGPEEAYIGDPLWSSMAEWADVCHQRGGLVVSPHFPYPMGEIATDIVLGKIDAVEILPHDDPAIQFHPLEQFNSLRYVNWYHYLNCGYRLPAVSGTDKMGANVPVGANRVYVYLGQQEFNYPNYAKAVRAGNTFATSGPLLIFHADGRSPGEEIRLGAGGGTIEVTADAQSFVPFHRLEVVYNGKIVAAREEAAGARSLRLVEKIQVPGPGWLAARCASQLGPTTDWNFKIAAHTSPVYLQVPGQELFSTEAAAYLLNLIEGAQMYVARLATRPGAETFAKTLKVYADARAALHRRMHQQAIPH
jgi:hypothetical protein